MSGARNAAAWLPAKSTIARDFGSASGTYDGAARLQQCMGQRLLGLADAEAGNGAVTRVLDLGSGTGYFSGRLQRLYPGASVTGADLSPGMASYASRQQSPEINWLVSDAEQLAVASASLDVVFSNLMIQWCQNPERVLRECFRVLKPGGLLLCSTLLDGTLRELDQAWQQADPGQRHVNRFISRQPLQGQLAAVFPGAGLYAETVVLDYPSPLALLSELKTLGAQYKARGRRATLTAPARIRRVCDHYPRAADGRVQASYEAGYLVGRKPLLTRGANSCG